MKILNTPWRWFFFIVSMLARLPLSMVPVLMILGTVGSGDSIGDAGLLLAALAIGAGIAGLVQGPAWDRVNNTLLYLILSILAAVLLVSLASLPISGALSIAIAAFYGLARPQTSTVVRNAWIEEFRDSSELSAKSVSLDITANPLLNIVGPLIAGSLFSLLGYQGSLWAVAGLGLVSGLLLCLALLRLKRQQRDHPGSLLKTAEQLLLNPPLLTLFVVSFLVTAASASLPIFLTAQLEVLSQTSWLSGLLALNALGWVIGAVLFRKVIARSPGRLLHLLILGEAAGLLLYAGLFMLPPVYLWLLGPLGALFIAPVATTTFLLTEARVGSADRSASFSLLASIQFGAVAAGQAVFSQVADFTGPVLVTVCGALTVLLAVLIWTALPYGMRSYRIKKKKSWWPEDLDQRCQEIETLPPAERDLQYREIIDYAAEALDSGTVPDLPRSLLHQDPLPPSVIRLSALAWNKVFAGGLKTNGLITALECGQWYSNNGLPDHQSRIVALSFGFQFRHFSEPWDAPLPERWFSSTPDAQRFAALYYASALRAGRRFQSVINWLQRPEIAAVCSGPVFESLDLLSRWALGQDLEQRDQFERLWGGLIEEEKQILIDALNLSLNQDRARWLLAVVERYQAEVPGESGVIQMYVARALRTLGRLEEAKKAILEAYEDLPFNPIGDSNSAFIEQLDVERIMIEELASR